MDTIKPHPTAARKTVTIASNTHINDKLGKYIPADSLFVNQFGLAKLVSLQ